MSHFKFVFITPNGSALARIAKSQDKNVVFTRAKAGSHFDNSRGDLGVKGIQWFDGPYGSIERVESVRNLVVDALFDSSLPPGFPIKSVALCAQIKKDGESPSYDPKDDVIFAIVSDDNSCFVSGIACTIRFDLSTQCLGMAEAVGESDIFDPSAYYTKAEIDGAFISSVSYNSTTNSLHLESADGVKQIDISLG